MTRKSFICCDKITLSAGLLITLLMAIAGCQKPATTIEQKASTTFEPQVEKRQWPEAYAFYKNVAVPHDTLYLAGPYEQSGGDNIYDELKTEDLEAALLCPAAFLGNVVSMPCAMIRTPPTQTQHSRSVFPLEAPAYEPLILQTEQYNK